jgi:hypothetical protein
MPDTALSGIAADEAAGTEYDIINQSINQSINQPTPTLVRARKRVRAAILARKTPVFTK